jgi:hypothetical protein
MTSVRYEKKIILLITLQIKNKNNIKGSKQNQLKFEFTFTSPFKYFLSLKNCSFYVGELHNMPSISAIYGQLRKKQDLISLGLLLYETLWLK